MDLKNLLIDKDRPPQVAGTRVGAKKTLEEIRQGLYKRTGAKTSSEGRTLRSIQVNQKRNDLRAQTQNKGRRIEEDSNLKNDENKNLHANTGSSARMSRKDKLAEYLRQKKTAQDCKKNKSVQPFRCGKVQHPLDSLAALPPVPGTRFSAQTSERRSSVKKVREPRVPLRSSSRRQSQSQASIRSNNMSRDPAPRARMAPARSPVQKSASLARTTPLERASAKKRGQQQTPKQATKSFAPKHFQFSMNVPMPEKPAVMKSEDSHDEIEKTDDLNKTFEKTSPEAKDVMEVETHPDTDKDSVPKTPEPEPNTNRGRRSRRISGVQPDSSLTLAQLNKTPAKRAKERSVSCDRRRSLRWIESGLSQMTEEHHHEDTLDTSPQLLNTRSSRWSLKASNKKVKTPAKDDSKEEEEEESSTPDLKESLAKMAPITIPSTVKRRMTRMSMNVIKESETEAQEENINVDTMTPVSSLTNKIKNAVIESERKDDSFKTPKSSRLTKVKAASERVMRVMSPLSSVNKVRGSSKRKRYSPEAKDSVATLFENLEGSPLLAKLEAKLKSNEEITEEDFVTEAPVSKQIRLDKDFDIIAEEDKVSKEIEETTSVSVSPNETNYDVPYFRNLLKTETDRLTSICNDWEAKLQDNLSLIEEDIQGEIRTVIGQGRLVMKERFGQFSGLVDNCEFKRGEKETTTTDLMGFWEMIYFQVSDVDKKLGKLKEIEKNNWKEVVPKAKVFKKKVVQKPSTGHGGPNKAASSGLRAMIAAKRKAAMVKKVAPEPNEVEMQESPGVRKSKRKSVSTHTPNPVVIEQVSNSTKTDSDGNQFDGGFFKISSPARQSPSASPKEVLTPSRSSVRGDHLRRVAVLNHSHRRSVSGLMLSPYVSNAARRSLPSPASPLRSLTPSSPATGLLVNLDLATDSVVGPIIDGIIDPIVPLSSPVTKTYSKTGVSPAAKQRENDAFDMVMASSSPRIDEKYFLASDSVQDQELISFNSPVPEQSIDLLTKKGDSTPHQRSRRSSRMKTPMK